MKSYTPLFFKSVYQWFLENDCSPQILVATQLEGVMLPANAKIESDGTILLNIFPSSVDGYTQLEDGLAFRSRFNGISGDCFIPFNSILFIGCKENNIQIQMMDFVVLKDEPVVEEKPQVAAKPHLSIVK